MSSADLSGGIMSIRMQVARWAEFDAQSRGAEGLKVADDTHIIAPPCWPTHGQIARWVELFEKVEAALEADATPDLLEAAKWAHSALAPFSKEPAEKSGINLLRAAIAKATGDA